MDEELKAKAIGYFENGDCEKLYKIILPFIELQDPLALWLYSRFSLPEFNETDEEFAKRSISLATEASEHGVSEASYRMGVNYLYGDDVQQSYDDARAYFERAIEQGHSYTKFTYGFSIFYGTDQNERNESRGLELMREAANEGIELAIKELEKINDKKA